MSVLTEGDRARVWRRVLRDVSGAADYVRDCPPLGDEVSAVDVDTCLRVLGVAYRNADEALDRCEGVGGAL